MLVNMRAHEDLLGEANIGGNDLPWKQRAAMSGHERPQKRDLAASYSLLLIRQTIWYTLPVGERWVNPLPDEASRAKWEPEKKDPLRGSFFSYRPLAGAAPRSGPTQHKVHAPKRFCTCTENVEVCIAIYSGSIDSSTSASNR